MLDACPHHHEETTAEPVEASLDDLQVRNPRAGATTGGKKVWRSLDELSKTEDFEKLMHREFPHAASEWNDGHSRRNFLKLMSASLALGGLTACTLRKTSEKIVPYVDAPEYLIPGRPLFYASSVNWHGYGKGVIVESHEGRPTKIEGNPDHPASLGATDIWMQASILDLYDPDRSQTVRHGDAVSTWGEFTVEMEPILSDLRDGKKGDRVRFLTGAVTSPTMIRQINELIKQYPGAKWHQYETVGRRNCRDGMLAAFGKDLQAVYAFDKADVIVSLDCNFFSDLPGSVVYAGQFIDGRRIRQGQPAKMNRLYVAENLVTITGASADHRLAIRSSEIETLAAGIAAAVSGTAANGERSQWINAVAKDLLAAKGRSLIVVGEHQPPAVHALAAALNDTLGNVGTTINYVEPIEGTGPGGPATLEELIDDANHDRVDLLFIFGVNPSFTAPPQMNLTAGSYETGVSGRRDDYEQRNPLARIKTVVHHGMYFDETAFFNTWHIPASHFLEAWADLRAFDGTASIAQPLIYPLYSTKSEIELLSFVIGANPAETGQIDRGGYDLIRDTWATLLPKPFEPSWQKALEKGVIPNTASPAVAAKLSTTLASMLSRPTAKPAAGGMELVFRQDPNIWDGRHANNSWLQELPKPVTLLTWDTAAFMSYKTAVNLGVTQDQPGRPVKASMIEIKHAGVTQRVPALVVPGHAEDSITVYLGYGRGRSGRIGEGVGINTGLLRPSTTEWFNRSTVDVSLVDDIYKLATVQHHHLIDTGKTETSWDNEDLAERNLVHQYTLDEVKARDNATPNSKRTIALPLAELQARENDEGAENETLLPSWKYDYNKWSMMIDNNACIGCNACVVACQSENNIPVVGKEQVLNDREMHWIRIDTYFVGEAEEPDTYFQPLPCMHCENAPCTLVCPVEATTISAEGINEMTYNRCVGTRYCSNNCPYKVRRFNFLYYNDYEHESVMLGKNPNVTVRGRGVMEKCNYCVQRINNGRIEAKKQDRVIAPGEVVTACAQACPTHAIMFGNLNDPRWEVSKLQDEPLRYTLLDDLNTLPRTRYLARVKNPNPELAPTV